MEMKAVEEDKGVWAVGETEGFSDVTCIEPPESETLVETQTAAYSPRVSDSVGLRTGGLRICISNKSPGEPDAVVHIL